MKKEKQQKITSQKPQNYKDFNYLGENRQSQLEAQPQRSESILSGEEKSARKASTRIGFYFSIAALLVAFAAIAALIYWTTIPVDVLEINKGKDIPVGATTSQLDGKYYAVLKLDFCKKTAATGTVERFLVGVEKEIRYPVVEDKIEPQCAKVDAPTLIPSDTPSGTYYIRYKVTYKVTPLRREAIEEFKTEKFKHL